MDGFDVPGGRGQEGHRWVEGLDLVGMLRSAPVVPLSPDGFWGAYPSRQPDATFSRILKPIHFFRLRDSDHHILQWDHCTCSLILSVICVCVCVCVCAWCSCSLHTVTVLCVCVCVCVCARILGRPAMSLSCRRQPDMMDTNKYLINLSRRMRKHVSNDREQREWEPCGDSCQHPWRE